MGDTFAFFQVLGNFSVSRDCNLPVSKALWKISCRIGESPLCNVCNTMGWNLSEPAALCGFKPMRSLLMPSARHFGVGTGILPTLDWDGRAV